MTYLLDANVLIALAWPGHAFHERVQRWFGRNSAAGWATCPFTQAAFVQIVSNPAFSDRSPTPLEAMESLAITLKHPHHQFWPDDLGFSEAVKVFRSRLVGHRQTSDAYLLGLALHRGGKLAVLDRGILTFLAPSSPQSKHVELISA
jgi:toxin-antitoxin system PIN domain toxin